MTPEALSDVDVDTRKSVVERAESLSTESHPKVDERAESLFTESDPKIDEKPAEVKSRRFKKASKFKISPFMSPPESTEQEPKVRARSKNVAKFQIPLRGLDHSEIPNWFEV